MSDSEDFESADEGNTITLQKNRSKRTSSSNYSDQEPSTPIKNQNASKNPINNEIKLSDGWDDFEITDNEDTVQKPHTSNEDQSKKSSKKSDDTGWDDFGDWGEQNVKESTNHSVNTVTENLAHTSIKRDGDIKTVTDRLSEAASSNISGWGWGGWGVDSLLNSATAGISSIASNVSQGITTVLETGIGAPNPEDLARQTVKEEENKCKMEKDKPANTPDSGDNKTSESAFQFGSLLFGVTKFVESTSTKVISGSLDTLETIGKKTMEVLQDGDPGLAKKRAMLGLEPVNEKPILSQVLREAKMKADEVDRIREEKREAKEIHYETLFDNFDGLMHLEALEMLSKRVTMQIEDKLSQADFEKRREIKETMQQVAELCEMPEDEDDDDDSSETGCSKAEAFHNNLQTATQDLALRVPFQSIVSHYNEVLEKLSSNAQDLSSEKAVYKLAVTSLAQCTALAVQIYHKTAEMLLVKTRRSTADETDALTQVTVVLTKHVSELANVHTEKFNSIKDGNKEQINSYITNIFLEAENSSTYIQNAFQLTLPILQIGAV